MQSTEGGLGLGLGLGFRLGLGFVLELMTLGRVLLVPSVPDSRSDETSIIVQLLTSWQHIYVTLLSFTASRSRENVCHKFSKLLFVNRYDGNANFTYGLGAPAWMSAPGPFRSFIRRCQPITNSRVITNEFNHYFDSIGHNLTLLQSVTNYNIPFSNYLNSSLLECFSLIPTWWIEIENIITNLKLGKSAGPFSTPVKLLN